MFKFDYSEFGRFTSCRCIVVKVKQPLIQAGFADLSRAASFKLLSAGRKFAAQHVQRVRRRIGGRVKARRASVFVVPRKSRKVGESGEVEVGNVDDGGSFGVICCSC